MHVSRCTLYDIMITSSPKTKFDVYDYEPNSRKFKHISRDYFSKELLANRVTMQYAIGENRIRVYTFKEQKNAE